MFAVYLQYFLFQKFSILFQLNVDANFMWDICENPVQREGEVGKLSQLAVRF